MRITRVTTIEAGRSTGPLRLIAPFCLFVVFSAAAATDDATKAETERPLALEASFEPRVVISPDRNYLVATTAERKLFYSRKSNQAVLRSVYGCQPMAMNFSSDGRFFAFAGEHGTIKHVDWADGTQTRILVPATPPHHIAVSARHVVIATETTLHCLQVPGGEMVWSFPVRQKIRDLKFADDGRRIVAQYADGTVRSYDAARGKRNSSKCSQEIQHGCESASASLVPGEKK